MNLALGIFFVLHGFAHGAGVLSDVRWSRRIGGEVHLLQGSITVGPGTLRAMAGVWVALALGFAVAGVATIAQWPWAAPFALGVASVSLVMSALHWPDARLGVFINAGIVVGFSLFLALRHGA